MFVHLASCVVCVFCVSAKKCEKANIGGVEQFDIRLRRGTRKTEATPKPLYTNDVGEPVKVVLKPKNGEPVTVMKLVVKTRKAESVTVTFTFPDGTSKEEVSVRRLCGPFKRVCSRKEK